MTTPRPVAVGPRVLLRGPAPADADAFVELRRASRDFLERWEPRVTGIDGFGADYFERYLRHASTGDGRRLLLCRVDDGRIIGHVGIGIARPGPPGTAYVGYWIGERYARRGYMTEGIALTLDHVFDALGMHRVEVNIQPSNRPSIGLAEKLGFRREGFSPKYIRIDGVWADHVRYAMLEEEWSALRRRFLPEPDAPGAPVSRPAT